MAATSIITSSFGLPYHEEGLVPGAQTIRLGQVGPVSDLLGGIALTGCFV
jgi:hypothetical protein